MTTHPALDHLACRAARPRKNDGGRQVMVMIGEPERTLVAGLQHLGFTRVAAEGEVAVWSRALRPPVVSPVQAVAEVGAEPAGPTGLLLMTIVEAAAALGVGRSTVYELIGQQQLEVVHIGRSARVPRDSVRALVTRLQDAERYGRSYRRSA